MAMAAMVAMAEEIMVAESVASAVASTGVALSPKVTFLPHAQAS
jgi:hypothetical protein